MEVEVNTQKIEEKGILYKAYIFYNDFCCHIGRNPLV